MPTGKRYRDQKALQKNKYKQETEVPEEENGSDSEDHFKNAQTLQAIDKAHI